MKLRILKFKQPVEHIHGEYLTEKIEFPIKWAGQDNRSHFQAYSDKGSRFCVWGDGAMTLDGKKIELVKGWEIIP